MLSKILFNTKNIEKSAYIWNTCASMLNAFQTVLILMVISRIDPVTDAGVFTIAFAIGNLMLTVGMYGIRQFQVSDVNQTYNFHAYLAVRCITCLVMLVVSGVYVGFHFLSGLYAKDKSIVILLVCFAKATDAFEDVFHGMLQQKGRLDVAGKILTLRLTGYIVAYLCGYLCTGSLVSASLLGLVLSLFIFLFLDILAVRDFIETGQPFRASQIKGIIMECFPLFISMYLAMYAANAPKYAIDKALSSEAQASFNYIFMPVFVIGLLSQFVYQPVIGKLAQIWHMRKKYSFYKLIFRQCAIILGLAISALIGGYLLGIPGLSVFYGVDLSGYRNQLMILLIGGGFLAYVYFFQMVMTVIRQQNWLVVGYGLVYVAFLILGHRIVDIYGLIGISLFYTINMGILAIIFALWTLIRINVVCKAKDFPHSQC